MTATCGFRSLDAPRFRGPKRERPRERLSPPVPHPSRERPRERKPQAKAHKRGVPSRSLSFPRIRDDLTRTGRSFVPSGGLYTPRVRGNGSGSDRSNHKNNTETGTVLGAWANRGGHHRNA